MKHSAAIHAASSANSASDPASTSARHLVCRYASHTCEYAAHPATTPTRIVADPRTHRTKVDPRDLHPSPTNPATNVPTVAPTMAPCGSWSRFEATSPNPTIAPTSAPNSARPAPLAPTAAKTGPQIGELIIQMLPMDSSWMNARVLSIQRAHHASRSGCNVRPS